jgi:uncharacterized protein YjbI with pentapeptide repeats
VNRYALIKDSINDNIFGVVVDSNGLSKFYGVSAKGIEWSKWVNGISVKSANDGLPAGIVVGEYSPLRNDNSGYVQALVDTVSLRNPSVNRKQGISDSLVKNSSSVTPSVRDAELRAFDTDKRADAINFKARAFHTDSKVTSLLTQVRAEKLGFVSSDGAFTSRNPVSIPEVKQAEIIDTYGRSIQRAIGKNLIRKKSARMVTVVRAVKQTASGIEFKAAGLGPKIGSRLSGGLRAAPAGMSFVDVTGVTDADTDGIVFEGKPGLERPIIPRFIVPKDLARKLSGIVQGDAEAIEKQRRAGNTSVQFDEGKLRKIIESVGGDANLLTAVTGEDGIPATTPSGRERLSVSAPKPSGIARDIARDAVIGGRLRSNQRPDLGDPTPLSPGELKKLSQQDLVDRLLEDRFAGLNLEEAARKYGLRGGRAEARRLEAREMQRRRNEGINMPDGMRSRQTTPSGNRLFTQEEFDSFFYDPVLVQEMADFEVYVSDPRDRDKWLKEDEVDVDSANDFGKMLLDEFPGRLSFSDDHGFSRASFDSSDLSDEARIRLSDALSYFPELLTEFEESPSDSDGMRSRTIPPFVTREDYFNFEDYDFNDQVADAMWNWLGRPDQQEMRERGGSLETLWEDFKKSDEYRDLEADLLSDNLKDSGATPQNPVTISSGGNQYLNATVKYDGEKFIIESQRWDGQAEEVVDGPGDGEEFDSLNEAEEFVSSIVGDSIGYEGMRSRSSSAQKRNVRDFVTSELDDRTISKIRQQLKDVAGNVNEDSQQWEFDAEYLGDALGLTGRWGSVDEVEDALGKDIEDILNSVINGIEDRIADNPDQVNEYGALYDFASAARYLLDRPDAEWTKPDVDDSEAILEFNDRPYLAIAKTDDGEFVVLQGTVLPSFDYYEQDSFDLEEIGGPFKTMDEAIEAGNRAYRKERFSESMLSAQDDRMDVARTADENISIEREAEDAWDNLNDLDKYRMIEEYAISRGANPGGNDWDPNEWEPDVMEEWMDDYISDRSGMRLLRGMRSTTATQERPKFNVDVSGSSALRQASYDDVNQELIVTFANGRTYTYENVGLFEFPDALTGKFINDLKKRHSVREGGQHAFDPEYQGITGPGQRTGRSRLSRSGSGTKTQIPVSESSAIEALTWDDTKKDLIVTYKGGRTYTYKDVDDYWVGDLEEDDAGTGRIINNIKKEGYQVVEGGEHGEMPSEGLTAERGRFGMRSRASREKNLPLTEWAGEKPGKENLKPNADLGGADLSNQDLSKYDLSGAVLGLSDLSDSKLPIGLDRANLDEAILEDVDGSFVSLTGASLNEAILSGSDFSNANMTEARLIDAFFYQANLSEANLKLAQAHTAYFDEANLEGANLENITATRASFKNANMRRANLAGADLRLADLRNADLTSANLENANITGANIDGADFEGANLEGVTLPDGWEIVDGEVQRVDENRTGIDGFRSRSGVQKYGSGVVSNGRILYQDDVSRINRGGKTRINVGNSRAARAITWDDDNRDLIVTFGSGRTYTYEGVDDDLIRELEESPDSVGSVINKIKNSRVPFTEGGKHAPQSTLYSEVQRQREALGMRSRRSSRPIKLGSNRASAEQGIDAEFDRWADGIERRYKNGSEARDALQEHIISVENAIYDMDLSERDFEKLENYVDMNAKNIRAYIDDVFGPRDFGSAEYGDEDGYDYDAWSRGERQGMRSRMAPSASRIRAAEMEVSARPQGMASRRSEGLRDARFAVPGRDRVDPSDGQLWVRLSDEDKKTVADRAIQREKFLLGEFKKRFPNWWKRANGEAEKNGWDKELMGGRNAGWLDELHRFVTKLSDDPNYPEKARLDAERDFNDLQALFNMRSNRGQHDLLEHLNPTSRRYLFDDARRADGKTTKISSSGKEMKTASTAPRPFGEPVDTGNPIREQVGEKQKKPLKERLDAFYKRMSDKILYEDPARKQRREMRKARRQGINVGGFTQAEANPVDDAKRKIRKRKRLKEMRKYRSRDVETISKESQKNRVDGKLAHTGDSGEMVFGEKLVPTLSTMMENYRTSKQLKKTTGSTNKNKALAVLWDGAGYNGTPQIITP